MSDEPVRRLRFFDLRFAIAGLFSLFGVIVTTTDFPVADTDLATARGVNLSLWTGVGMLLLAGVFWMWLLVPPVAVPPVATRNPLLNLQLNLRD